MSIWQCSCYVVPTRKLVKHDWIDKRRHVFAMSSRISLHCRVYHTAAVQLSHACTALLSCAWPRLERKIAPRPQLCMGPTRCRVHNASPIPHNKCQMMARWRADTESFNLILLEYQG